MTELNSINADIAKESATVIIDNLDYADQKTIIDIVEEECKKQIKDIDDALEAAAEILYTEFGIEDC